VYQEKEEIGRTCSMHAKKTYAYRVLVGKPEGKRPLGTARFRWKNNIKRGLIVIGWGGMDWIWLRIKTSGGLL
jgi:hypothetical protein